MKISLVIPTYKKQTEVLDQLERLYGYLSRKNSDFELIFVIDGYVDNTKHILQEYIKQNRLKKAYVIGYKQNKGKGYAIRYGMRKASGDIIGYIDADTDIQIRTLGYAINEIKKPTVMAVIPSKFHKDSNANMTYKRRALSSGLVFLNKLFLEIPQNVTDIGCGLKLFKKELIQRLLPNLKIDGFAIDSEILNEIGKIGYPISVIPFFLNINRSPSTSANISQTTTIVKDIFNIAINNKIEGNTKTQILEYRN